MRRLLLGTAAALVLAAPAGAQTPAGDCPGVAGTCPYTAQAEVGQRSGGVVRFPQTIAVAPDGRIAVGDQHSHVVHVFGPDGTFLRELGVPGRRAGELSSVGALAFAPDGSLYVADGQSRIDQFAADGRLVRSFGGPGTDVGRFRFGAGGGNDAGAGGGLAVGAGFLWVADSGNDRIQRFDLDGRNPRVIVPPGTLAYPKGIAVRGTRLLIADDQNHRVLAYDLGGRRLADVGRGTGTGPGQMVNPYGVALDAQGRLFVADNLNHRIQRFGTAPAYPYVARFGAFGTLPGRLAYVRGLAVDGQGNVLVANTGNDRIDVFTREGALVRSFGRSGRGVGQFNMPTGVAADAQGVRAVTDAINGRVVLLGPGGDVLTTWGTPNPGPTILRRPVAAVFDGAGTLYVLDQRRARIFVFARGTGLPVRSIASQGSGPGRLLDPSAMAIAPDGTLVVADTGNRRLARFGVDGSYRGSTGGVGQVRGVAVSPDGQRTYAVNAANVVYALAPDGREVATFGGTGSKLGKLNSPAQLTVDAAGTLWVADRGNNRVQRFGPDGERLAAFGARGTGPGRFTYPTGVSTDCNGLLTVTDEHNNRVQQFLVPDLVRPCAQLPALGTPPAPRVPTLPPPPGPDLQVKLLRKTGLLRGGATVPVRVRCDTPCTLELAGTLAERTVPKPKKGAKRRRPVVAKLRPAKLQLGGASSRIVRVAVDRTGAAKLRRALKGRKGLALQLDATATAATGEVTEVPTSADAGA